MQVKVSPGRTLYHKNKFYIEGDVLELDIKSALIHADSTIALDEAFNLPDPPVPPLKANDSGNSETQSIQPESDSVKNGDSEPQSTESEDNTAEKYRDFNPPPPPWS